jgi:hypothetical protein
VGRIDATSRWVDCAGGRGRVALRVLGVTATAASMVGLAPWATNAGAASPPHIKVEVTAQGCAPRPDTVVADFVTFDLKNKGAKSVSEVELRSGSSHILGAQQDLVPGLTGNLPSP